MATSDKNEVVTTEKSEKKESFPMTNWVYDIFLWTFSLLVDLFFREVHPRGSWKVPRRGPVIFVAAPHANQVRSLMLPGNGPDYRGWMLTACSLWIR
jgi:1-acyl-sn-glycerol-3-phosphate acyltransferase